VSKVLVFVPMYNCARQIGRVFARFGPEAPSLLSHILVVDNGSQDSSLAEATRALQQIDIPATILCNDHNYNLGGSHKVAFDYAIAHGFDQVLVLHGDDQADIGDALAWLRADRQYGFDCVLGSRFSRGSRREGYSRFRTFGNIVFNTLFSLVAGRMLVDLGSGLNLFSVAWLKDRFWTGLADDLTFNNHLLLAMVQRRARFIYLPITWREEDQVSNVRLFRQARRTVGIVVRYGLLRGRYLWRRHAQRDPDAYTATVVWTASSAHSPVAEHTHTRTVGTP